ncbi:hypothetical protein OC845_000831 [Tilletia horrida]|nr:hypothetical protein OC845_000831 [Tilletia horrida]
MTRSSWSNDIQHGRSNLSHRFRRAVISGDVALAVRLSTTALRLSESLTSARRTSTAETIRKDEDPTTAVAGLGENAQQQQQSQYQQRLAVPIPSGSFDGLIYFDDDNPATPTMPSHWAEAAATTPSPSQLTATPTVATISTMPSTHAGAAATGVAASPSRSLRSHKRRIASVEADASAGLVPASPATQHSKDQEQQQQPEQQKEQPRHRYSLLPPMVRYDRADPSVRKYIPPSERAMRAQKAALDAPFTVQNVDPTSPPDSEGRKPSLILAIEHGTSIEMIAWLLEMQHEAGGPSTDDDNNTVFALAAIYNRCDVIELYTSQPDIDVPSLLRSKSTSEGRTALHWAAIKGHDQVIRLLLKLGAHVDALDNSNTTPLHFASAWGHLNSVQLLKQVGANSTISNKEGFCALDWAFDANIKVALETFDDVYHYTHHKSHGSGSYSTYNGSDGHSSSTRSPRAGQQPLPDFKSVATSASGPPAELGAARSVVMSKDQVAREQFRRMLPNNQQQQQQQQQSQPLQQQSAQQHQPSLSLSSSAGPPVLGATGRQRSDVQGSYSPSSRPGVLRAAGSGSGESRRSITLSPDFMRSVLRSPPRSPPSRTTPLR